MIRRGILDRHSEGSALLTQCASPESMTKISVFTFFLIIGAAFLAAILIINYAAAQEEGGGEIIIPNEKIVIPEAPASTSAPYIAIPTAREVLLDAVSLDHKVLTAYNEIEKEEIQINDLASKYAKLYDSCRFSR